MQDLNIIQKLICFGNIGEELIDYVLISILLLIGVILGTLYVRNMSEESSIGISTYLNQLFVGDDTSGLIINKAELFRQAFFSNIFIVFLLFIAGLTIFAIPITYFFVVLKGFSIGYTLAAIVNTLGIFNGIKAIFSLKFFQSLVIIPCVIIMAVSGVKFHKKILIKGVKNIKIDFIKYMIIGLISMILILLTSLFETYISSWIFKMFFGFI